MDLIYWRESSFFQGRLEIFPALAEKHRLKGLSRNRKLADQEVAQESSKQCESKMELPWQKSSSNVALITRPSNQCKSLIDAPYSFFFWLLIVALCISLTMLLNKINNMKVVDDNLWGVQPYCEAWGVKSNSQTKVCLVPNWFLSTKLYHLTVYM